MTKARGYNLWILNQVRDYLGPRLLEAGSGIGNLSAELLNRQRLVLMDLDDTYIKTLQQKFAGRSNLRVEKADLTEENLAERCSEEELDTVLCSNVLEHLEPDVRVLSSFQKMLVPGGHCIIVVPAGKWLYTGMDEELGHRRRYTVAELQAKMGEAGLEVVFTRQFSRLGSIAWATSGHLMRRRCISPLQMTIFEKMLPVAKLLDRVLPIPGMSLIVVGRKPQRVAARAAA